MSVLDVELGGVQLLVIGLRDVATADVISMLPTEIQCEIARDAANGLSNTEIAHKRGRAVRTIANQLAAIYRRLGIGSRSELAARLLGADHKR